MVHVPKSAIASFGTLIDQYINNVIPRSVMFTLGYSRLSRSSVQVISPPSAP